MDIFELIIDDDLKGVQAISLVENPAIESDWITLAKETKVELAVVDDEKRILMGAALIPNKMIFRKSGDHEFNIYFSKKTVRKASELYFKNGFQSETTLDHVIPVDGNTVVESWIVEDKEKDKTNLHGLDVPIGTWMVSMKVEDDMLWKMAKDGEVKGFSIEGNFVDKVINKNMSKQTEVEKSKLQQIKEILFGSEQKDEVKLKDVKLAQETLDNGAVVEAESFEAGQPIFVVGEDENIPLPIGEYEWNGKILIVVEDGMIDEVKEAVAEVADDVEAETEFVTKDEFNNAINEIKALFSKQVQETNNEVAKLESEKVELEKDKVKLQTDLDAKPDAEKIKHAPKEKKTVLSKTKKGRLTQFLNNK